MTKCHERRNVRSNFSIRSDCDFACLCLVLQSMKDIKMKFALIVMLVSICAMVYSILSRQHHEPTRAIGVEITQCTHPTDDRLNIEANRLQVKPLGNWQGSRTGVLIACDGTQYDLVTFIEAVLSKGTKAAWIIK